MLGPLRSYDNGRWVTDLQVLTHPTRALLRVHHPSDEQDRAGGDIPNDEQERPVDAELESACPAGGSKSHDDHRGGSGFRAGFIDGHKGFMQDVADIQVARAVHTREISQARIKGIRHSHVDQGIR